MSALLPVFRPYVFVFFYFLKICIYLFIFSLKWDSGPKPKFGTRTTLTWKKLWPHLARFVETFRGKGIITTFIIDAWANQQSDLRRWATSRWALPHFLVSSALCRHVDAEFRGFSQERRRQSERKRSPAVHRWVSTDARQNHMVTMPMV